MIPTLAGMGLDCVDKLETESRSAEMRTGGSELKMVSETGGKVAGYGLIGASAAFIIINAETQYGHLRNSDKADLGVDIAEGVLASFEVSSPIGWAFGVGMFVGDLISEHYSGKSITENLFANDNN